MSNPFTGPANINKFLITSNTGKQADVSLGVVEYKYYENVLSNFITASVTVVETGMKEGPEASSLDGLPLRGGEITEIDVEDVKGNKIVLPEGLYVSRVRNAKPNAEQDIYQLDFASKEYFLNEQERVVKRYEGKISTNVEIILKEVLKTKAELDIDPTENNLNILGNLRKPLYTISWLGSKSIPERGGGSGPGGYLFYQNRDKINFKSIDKLFEKKEVRRFIYNDTGIPVAGYDANILEYSIDSDNDFDLQQTIGAYRNKTTYFDYFNQVFKTIDFSIFDAEPNVTTAGPLYINVKKEFIEKPTRDYFYLKDIAVNPPGVGNEQLKNWRSDPVKQNFDSELILVQTKMRYNQLFTVQLTIIIEGDFALKAGDIIRCDFPQLEDRLTKGLNVESSGIYMVGSVCHRITPSETFTSLGLIRDSFGT
jgi:hypothetical protein